MTFNEPSGYRLGGSAMNYCPNAEKHTPQPDGYLAWHDWAEKKSKTHDQVKCDGCGLYKIWKPKRRLALQPQGDIQEGQS